MNLHETEGPYSSSQHGVFDRFTLPDPESIIECLWLQADARILYVVYYTLTVECAHVRKLTLLS
jgi:hypothetical protein